MHQSTFLYSLLLTATALSMPVNATNLDEESENSHQELSKNFSPENNQEVIRRAQIKSSEDIGALLSTLVPQMRLVKDWCIPNANDKQQPLPVQSMIASSKTDPDAIIERFRQSAIRTFQGLIDDGFFLIENHYIVLYEKKMGEHSAYSMLAGLLARTYTTELLFQEMFASYAPHHEELKPYLTLHQTFKKEEESLQKLQTSQQKTLFPLKKEQLTQKEQLAAMNRELEEKIQKARAGIKNLKRLTFSPSNIELDFSSLTTEEPTSPLLSPRSIDSSSQELPHPKPSPSTSGSPQLSSSQDSVLQRGRAKSMNNQNPTRTVIASPSVSPKSKNPAEDLHTSSSPSLQLQSKKQPKEKRSGSMSEKSPQVVSPTALQESARFRSLSTATSSSETSEDRSESPKNKEGRSLLGSFKRALSVKKRSSDEIDSSLSPNASSSSLGSSHEDSSSPSENVSSKSSPGVAKKKK
ncbi:MAG: hypothetical protein BGO76_02990 [Caedibacter sp. 38-128]|nr:hypothetical protein [Holosporales bacterium]OJX06454.1 MAG: hypothetical protein BGO76_02990 [Caedibacter sp. 38-128]